LLRIREGDEWKTAFATKYGQFEYLVMPFGLCNASGTFQRMMEELLADLLDHGVRVFLDDLVIYTTGSQFKHDNIVKEVLSRLLQYGLAISIDKSIFSAPSIPLLGHIVSGEGVTMDLERISVIQQWENPGKAKNIVKAIQRFNGFANFYRRFIKGYSKIMAPITMLLSQQNPVWGPM